MNKSKILSDAICQEFNRDPSFIYLNSGTHSISPQSVVKAMQQYENEIEKNPTMGLFSIWEKLWKVQKALATFFVASPKDIFLRSNITEVMNNFILGMPLPSSAEILYSDLEYGAIKNICKYRAQNDHLKLREFKVARKPDDVIPSILAALRPETKLLVVSHVFTTTGLVTPILELAKETRKRGILLAIDGAHGPGALRIDFSQFNNIDFYGGNLHKWMMGPKGSAFGWVNPLRQENLKPLQAGWTTFEFHPEHAGFGEGSAFQGRFALSGSHNFSSFLAIEAMLEFWQKHGSEAIFQRIYHLQNILEGALEKTKLKCLSPPPGPFRGPLFAYELSQKLCDRGHYLMFDLLREKNLLIAIPPMNETRCMRFSPHIYNTENEMLQAAEIIAELVR